MLIKVNGNNNGIKLSIGLLSINIDYTKIDENIEDITHFLQLIFPSEDIKELYKEILNNIDTLKEYISCFDLGNYESEVKLCRKTNKVILKKFTCEESSLDIMSLMKLIEKINTTFI